MWIERKSRASRAASTRYCRSRRLRCAPSSASAVSVSRVRITCAGQEDSRLLAGALQAQLIAGLHPARERSAHTGEYYLLEHLDIPAVLVECGFLSNAAEEAKLLDAGYQQQVAQAICAGVCDFIQLSGK